MLSTSFAHHFKLHVSSISWERSLSVLHNIIYSEFSAVCIIQTTEQRAFLNPWYARIWFINWHCPCLVKFISSIRFTWPKFFISVWLAWNSWPCDFLTMWFLVPVWLLWLGWLSLVNSSVRRGCSGIVNLLCLTAASWPVVIWPSTLLGVVKIVWLTRSGSSWSSFLYKGVLFWAAAAADCDDHDDDAKNTSHHHKHSHMELQHKFFKSTLDLHYMLFALS